MPAVVTDGTRMERAYAGAGAESAQGVRYAALDAST